MRRAYFRFVSHTPDGPDPKKKRFSLSRRTKILIGCFLFLAASAAAVFVALELRPLRPGDPQQLAEAMLFEMINQERVKCKSKDSRGKFTIPVPEVQRDERLDKIAQFHARELSRKEVKSLLDEDLKREMEEEGYTPLFWGTVPAPKVEIPLEEAFQMWMKDKSAPTGMAHPRQILVNPPFEDVGIGVYRDRTTKALYVFILMAVKKK